MRWRRQDLQALLGLAPAALAAVLAAWGLSFGLPYLFRPDEDVMIGRAVRMAAEGSLDPLFQNYPPLVFDLFALAEKLAALAGLGTLVDPRTGDPSHAYLVGRILSAAAAAVTVALVFQLGRRAYGLPAALLAATLLAVAPLAVRQAHFATTDAIQVVLAAAAMLLAVDARTPRRFAGAGALCGLAAASKYTGGAVIVFVLVMAWQSRWRRQALLGVAAAAAVAFAIPSVVMVLHPRGYVGGLLFLGGRGYATQFQTPIGLIYHPTVSLPYGLGPGAYGLALAGVAVALWRRSPVDRALLAYGAVYLAVVGAGHEVFFRYVLPLLPVLALLAGRVLSELPRPALAPSALVCGLLLLPSLANSIAGDTMLTKTDSRVLAARWLTEHAPPGSTIVQGYYTGPFYDQGEIEQQLRYTNGDALAAAFLQGRYTNDYVINGPAPRYYVFAEAPPPLAQPELGIHDPAAQFSGTGSGGVYDPLDEFFLPIWGFDHVQRPGPDIVIVAGAR